LLVTSVSPPIFGLQHCCRFSKRMQLNKGGLRLNALFCTYLFHNLFLCFLFFFFNFPSFCSLYFFFFYSFFFYFLLQPMLILTGLSWCHKFQLLSQSGYAAPGSPTNRLPQQSPLWLMKHPARPTATYITFRYGRSLQRHTQRPPRRARPSEEPRTAYSQKTILQNYTAICNHRGDRLPRITKHTYTRQPGYVTQPSRPTTRNYPPSEILMTEYRIPSAPKGPPSSFPSKHWIQE